MQDREAASLTGTGGVTGSVAAIGGSAGAAGGAAENAGGSGSSVGQGGSSGEGSGGWGAQPIAWGGSGSIGAAGSDPGSGGVAGAVWLEDASVSTGTQDFVRAVGVAIDPDVAAQDVREPRVPQEDPEDLVVHADVAIVGPIVFGSGEIVGCQLSQ